MLRFGKAKVTKEKSYAAKKPMKICNFNVDNIVISKLIKTETNSKHFIGHLDKAMTISFDNASNKWICYDI